MSEQEKLNLATDALKYYSKQSCNGKSGLVEYAGGNTWVALGTKAKLALTIIGVTVEDEEYGLMGEDC